MQTIKTIFIILCIIISTLVGLFGLPFLIMGVLEQIDSMATFGLLLIIMSIAGCVACKRNLPQKHKTENIIPTKPFEVVSDDNIGSVYDFDEITVPERKDPESTPSKLINKVPPQTEFAAYYENGVLFDVNPRNEEIPLCEDRQTAYHARYIISDGVQYDLEDAENIKSIIIPRFGESMPNVTFDLSYILKMRVGSECRPHLAVPLAYKVANLMISSPIAWGKKDYCKLVNHLWSIGEISYGDNLLEELKKRVPNVAAENELKYIHKAAFEYQLELVHEFNEDYIISDCSISPCQKCASYRNRVFCISGRDKRFPEFSDYISAPEDFCCIRFNSFFYYPGRTLTIYTRTKNGVKETEVDAIEYSNRPFIDDRTDQEKLDYEEWKLKEQKRIDKENQLCDREYWIQKYYDKLEYQKIVELMGDKAPKSFSGYCRMKNSNSANFQKIVKLAKENGILVAQP